MRDVGVQLRFGTPNLSPSTGLVQVARLPARVRTPDDGLRYPTHLEEPVAEGRQSTL